MGGQADHMCDQSVNLAEQIDGGKIWAHAIATEKRSPVLQFQVSAWNAATGAVGEATGPAGRGTPR